MSKHVEFFFDFGSPYTYLAYHQLPKIAARHHAAIVWRPILLGAILKATGNHSPIEIPAKGRHAMLDLQRWAAHFCVPMTMNPHFPLNTLALMRGAVAMQLRSEAEFQHYLGVVFCAMFERPRNLGQAQELSTVLQENGIDPVLFQTLINDQSVKDQLTQNSTQAVERGVFGAPTFFVGEHLFWGQDRLHFVELALSAG